MAANRAEARIGSDRFTDESCGHAEMKRQSIADVQAAHCATSKCGLAVCLWSAGNARAPMGGVPLSCVLHRAQLRVADLQAEGLLGDSEECAALIGEGDLELAGALSGGGELLLAQKFLHGEGGVLR